MNYNDKKGLCTEASVPERNEDSLTELMRSTNEIGSEIVNMAERINCNLFGPNGCHDKKEASPMCFREALELHRSTLIQAADTLGRVCHLLGV